MTNIPDVQFRIGRPVICPGEPTDEAVVWIKIGEVGELVPVQRLFQGLNACVVHPDLITHVEVHDVDH